MKENKKLIIFGNQQLGIDCVNIIQKTPHSEVACVVGCETESDRNNGYPSLQSYCNDLNIPFYQPDKLDDSLLSELAKLKPDYCFSILYRNIFPKKWLTLPSSGFLNLHPSLLPKYRGATPNLWILLNGETESGVTLHYIDQGIDTGDIIAQRKFPIPAGITGFELNSLHSEAGSALLQEQIPLVLANTNDRQSQDHSQATYFGPFRPSVRDLDWTDLTQKTAKRIKALTHPYSGTNTSINGKQVTIWAAQPIDYGKDQKFSGPGRIFEVTPTGELIVSTPDGYLLISDYVISDINRSDQLEFVKKAKRFDI